MAKRNFIPVPRDIAARYRADEEVSHEVLKSVGEVRLWKSTLKRDRLPLPEGVRYHVADYGTVSAVSIAERWRAQDYFETAVKWEANRETYFTISHDLKNIDGCKVLGVFLSRKIARLSTARRVKRRLLRTYPNAYCSKHQTFGY